MPFPKSVTKFSKRDGVTFIDSVDRVNYTLRELKHTANKDVGKLITRAVKAKIKNRTRRLAKNTQYWARSRAGDLLVGFKPGGWYGLFQELGTEKRSKVGALRETVSENIPMIVRIQSQYLSGLEDEARALSMIREGDEEGSG